MLLVRATLFPSGRERGWAVFQNSFERKNLSYVVIEEDNKPGKMLNIVQKTNGSAIIYVRNRKRTKEIAEMLQKKGHAADYYHAGLDKALRNKRQDAWMNGDTRASLLLPMLSAWALIKAMCGLCFITI